ncbi:MFS transporter [Marinobacter sp. JSM 1782161]|uniref:MFS transporter n=1 Tax=Marinobacter sp. JSM 1782161 TaxID=2685906 RepID=UPI0014040265|nr:MFS transporter [Marinobacter sp. JSM 1782161]
MSVSMKYWLIGLTAIAVVSDSMLIPFYPHFFESAFGVTSAHTVGLYIAACCLTVMLAFPVWARVARRAALLPLLINTQLVAGGLSVLCYWTATVTQFWVVSLAMLVFKASYLLIYPQIMRLEQADSHGRTIGLLSVIVHFGGIGGALLGGAVLQWFEPRQVFLLMAVGDFLQTGICVLLKRRQASTPETGNDDPATPDTPAHLGLVLRLCSVMAVFYFSAFLIRPFFVRYWEDLSGLHDAFLSGVVFAIPGAVALLALWLSYRRPADPQAHWRILPAMLFVVAGLLLQAVPSSLAVLAGRVLFGWGLFRATVRLDQLLFALSQPAYYATDFSKVSFSQNLGVLVASWAAGAVVAGTSLDTPFYLAAVGLVISAVLFYTLLFRPQRPSRVASPQRSRLSRSEA